MLRLTAASAVLTPERPLPLAGYGRRTAPFETVGDDLEAVFLRLADDRGGAVVIGSIDTLYLTRRTLSDIAAALGDGKTPLCLFATHTHNAPSLAPDLPRLGRCDGAWYRSVVNACAAAIRRLEEGGGEAVALRYGERAAALNVNRRRPGWYLDYPAALRRRRFAFGRRVAHAPWRRGIVDRRVRALFFERSDGEVAAVLWSLAAHPAFCPSPLAVSADYPGLVRAALRRRFGAHCAVVYLPGLAGSAIPLVPLRWPHSWREAAVRLLPFYASYRSFAASSYRRWVARLNAEVLRAYAARGPALPSTGVAVRRATVAGIFADRGGLCDLQVAHVTLVRDLAILGCSGEMLAEWAPLLDRPSAGTAFLSGYLAGPALYVPTSAQLAEGGYEVTGFQEAFGLQGDFHPDISRLVASAVAGLVDAGG
jgi:hypothetical protein